MNLLLQACIVLQYLRMSIWPSWRSVSNTDETIDIWLCWSFHALSVGVHPTEDPYGVRYCPEFEPDRWRKAGTPIANGWRCFVSGHRGDWQHIATAL